MEEPSGASPRVIIGQALRPVGLHGELVVKPSGDDPGRFSPGRRVHIGSEPVRTLRIRASRPYRSGVAVRFEGIETVEAAEALRGAWFWVPANELPLLPPGVYYHYQLIGLEVLDAEGVHLGRIESILETGSNDVYCAREGEREILIPAVGDYVARVDLVAGRIYLAVPRAALGEDAPPI